MSNGFGRDKRLLDSRQFKAVFDAPSGRLSGQCLLILARPNDLGLPRLGMVIGKKNVKLSIQRNRLKRQIRESVRLNQDQLEGFDILVVARKGLGDIPNPELRQQLSTLWQRLKRKHRSSQPQPIEH